MSSWRWAAPERHETIGSTNTEALTDPRPGRVVVAEHQSAGQGRRGRRWSSAPGTGLAISAVLPPVPPGALGWVPLAAGLAVVQALEASRWPVQAWLKWPNDVLVTDGPRPGKIAGVLAQVSPAGSIVVGTGINVDHDEADLPVPAATSWRLARGGAVLPDGAREDLLGHYLACLAVLHHRLADGQLDRVRADWTRRCATLGRQVVVHAPDGKTTTGTATGVDRGGALLVATAGGVRTFHAGDVVHLRGR
jgi:BirA family transcriptional regulator, biotin operon repressor / biotin---[acetyl-CoA-carboxylase] ligase